MRSASGRRFVSASCRSTRLFSRVTLLGESCFVSLVPTVSRCFRLLACMSWLGSELLDGMSVPLDLVKDNVSLYSLPLSYGLLLLPHFYMEVVYFNKFGRWQNTSPR